MISNRSLFFAAAPPGLEPVLTAEIEALHFRDIQATSGGVSFSGDFETLCRANLCLRTASRVLLRVEQFFVVHLAKLHKKAAQIPWENYLRKDTPVVVRATCRKSKIYHSVAAAERVAKGIEERLGPTSPPNFGEGAPDEEGGSVCVLVRIERDRCTISLDTSGAHLHRRGYRLHTVQAPLRENLAAAALLMCKWSPSTEALLDPMCGSGTLPIEAALLASDTAPGLLRTFGFEMLPFFEKSVLGRVKEVLFARIHEVPCPILASDIDEKAVNAAQANATLAGVSDAVAFSQQNAVRVLLPPGKSLVLCNPPYGKRIGDSRALLGLYRGLGQRVRQTAGARAAVVTADAALAAAVSPTIAALCPPFPNGGIRVQVFGLV